MARKRKIFSRSFPPLLKNLSNNILCRVNIFPIVATTMMCSGVNAIATLLAILLTSFAITTSAFSVPPMATSYPRPLHPGGFSLPPMVEDLIPIATTIASAAADKDSQSKDEMLQKDLLLVRPPDMESLWEWYANIDAIEQLGAVDYPPNFWLCMVNNK